MAHMLVIDDDALIRTLLREVLEWQGITSPTRALAGRACNGTARDGVRIMACRLPVHSPWRHPMEPTWRHGQRAVAALERVRSTQELETRVRDDDGWAQEPHLPQHRE